MTQCFKSVSIFHVYERLPHPSVTLKPLAATPSRQPLLQLLWHNHDWSWWWLQLLALVMICHVSMTKTATSSSVKSRYGNDHMIFFSKSPKSHQFPLIKPKLGYSLVKSICLNLESPSTAAWPVEGDKLECSQIGSRLISCWPLCLSTGEEPGFVEEPAGKYWGGGFISLWAAEGYINKYLFRFTKLPISHCMEGKLAHLIMTFCGNLWSQGCIVYILCGELRRLAWRTRNDLTPFFSSPVIVSL